MIFLKSVSMDARKRKRFLKGHLLPREFIIFCFCLLVLCILLYRGFGPGPFRPGPIVPKLAVLTSSSISKSVRDSTTHYWIVDRGEKVAELRMENTVLFNDHVLVIVTTINENAPRIGQQRVDCVYNTSLEEGGVDVTYPMISADEYGDDRWLVRCPPPVNHTALVGLRGRWGDGVARSKKTAKSWDMLAYDAALDGAETAVVFVKGLRLKSDRESDASSFNCHFRKWGSTDKHEGEEESFGLTTKAITAVQEVIRCPLPLPVKEKLRNNEDVEVTVERIRLHQVVPSIARLSQKNFIEIKSSSYKYELCACSMVWNQAAFIKEWITYHAWLGVQRWFVYDNNSDDGLKDVIDELEEGNYNVTRHVWPWVKSQEAGFSHCVLRARDECRWVGFFDVDEFYYLPRPKNLVSKDHSPGALRAIVESVTKSSPSVGEIRADCHSFGPSGLKKSPTEGVTLGYTCRMKSPERHKSIVRPNAVNDTLMNQVHHFMLKKEFRKMTLSRSKAVINHYKYQVWDIFKAKFNRRVSTYVVDWQENQNEKSRDRAPGLGTEAIEPSDWHKRFCQVWDTRLRDFVLANLGDPDTGFIPWRSLL